MERLEKQSPTAALSAGQKNQIAEIESLAKAKIAEKELFLKEQIAKAVSGGDYAAVGQLEQQMAHDIQRIHADAAEKKEQVRAARG